MTDSRSLFSPRTEEATIDLAFHPNEIELGRKLCICCPADHPHVFGYGHDLPGTTGGGYSRRADDMVRELLYQAFRQIGNAAEVNRHRVRITVELIAP